MARFLAKVAVFILALSILNVAIVLVSPYDPNTRRGVILINSISIPFALLITWLSFRRRRRS